MRLRLSFLLLALPGFGLPGAVAEAVWQWSVPMGEGRAFLWIPDDCRQVRAVVVAQHNMLEEGILEHPAMRREFGRLGIAEVWIAPQFDFAFDFTQGAGERLEAGLNALAAESGYGELAFAPVIPLGHSACASYPWNFAAWNPARTLAVISLKGDAPLTNLTGSGRPNPEWGDRSIDGIPGLMIMGEYEWWEDRLAPAVRFRAGHPGVPVALLADVGHGHFDALDPLVEFLALFIRKAAECRLPAGPVSDRPSGADLGRSETGPTLKPVDPASGWLVDRWRRDEPLRAVAAPAADYTGNRAEAFWCFDEEMARATTAYYGAAKGKKAQQVNFALAGRPVDITTTHAGVLLAFQPLADGLTFKLGGTFIGPLPPRPPTAAKDKPPPPTAITPTPAAADAHAPGAVRVSRITGPVVPAGPDAFRVQLNRTASTVDKRSGDIWLLASHPGDDAYKDAVQQALLKIAPHRDGTAQAITFPAVPDQRAGVATLQLAATSDSGAPVSYYVREGPAEVDGSTLRFTTLPPRARLPLKVTVVAWQWGRAAGPKLQTAAPVERSFLILP